MIKLLVIIGIVCLVVGVGLIISLHRTSDTEVLRDIENYEHKNTLSIALVIFAILCVAMAFVISL